MSKHPAHPPSGYATIRVGYGSENKHLYTSMDWGDIEFHPDRKAAEAAARDAIASEPNAVIALMKVEELIAAKIEVQTVSVATA